MGLPAGQRGAMREDPAQRRAPECHLVVGPAPHGRTAPGAQQRDPESERQRRHDPVRIVSMPVSRQFGPGVRDALQSTPVETRAAVVVPNLSVSFAKRAVHGVTRRNLQALQRSVESSAYGGIPDMEPDRSFPIIPCGIEIGAEAFTREENLEIVEDFVRVAEVVDDRPPGSPYSLRTPRTRLCHLVCARGSCLKSRIRS